VTPSVTAQDDTNLSDATDFYSASQSSQCGPL